MRTVGEGPTPSPLTFGEGETDRAAALRGDPARMADLLRGGTILPMWRGKPLMLPDDGGASAMPTDPARGADALPAAAKDRRDVPPAMDDGAALVWLPSGHPVLEGGLAPVFLGLEGGVARFAQDVSAWTPPATDAAVETGFADASRQHHPDAPAGAAFVELRSRMTLLSSPEAGLAATARAIVGWHEGHRFCATCGSPSTVDHAGWRSLCPACGKAHFPRTDPVVIMLVTRGNAVLMGRSPGWPEGMYSCLAGFVEPGETLEAAVRREVREETEVEVGAVRYVASQPWPFPASLMIGFVAEALSDAITCDPVEIEDARWIGKAEMMEAMAGQHPTLKAARKGAIAHYLIGNWLAGRLD